ncbi:MAG: ATP-binding protein [Deltaproteobacteria bacterium]|nr:ATP-binding protein [Deltaproteobacteria bacterium]
MILSKLPKLRFTFCSLCVIGNLPFTEWVKVFDSSIEATAIADRLVHNSFKKSMLLPVDLSSMGMTS